MKLLIGGSPCTHWSIAQTKNRETEASGIGLTVDVIAHIMSHFEGLTTEPVEVLSMYDGMSCGHIALDKLGVQPWLLRYYATEIDKYAIQTTQHNFPETIQLGDAFQVRNDDWRVED